VVAAAREPTSRAGDQERVDPRVWRIGAVVMCGPLMSGLDATMVNVALDTMGRDLQVPLTTVQWVSSAYLLALALALPLNGWLVDRVGARRVFVGCFAVFLAGSALSGLAGSVPQLLMSRVLQGLAGGLLAPMAQMMMARHAGKFMARVMGITAMPVMIGQILGPSLGGLILAYGDWHWMFFVNLPVGVIAIVLAIRLLPPDELARPRRLDLLGIALLSPGLAMSLIGLVELPKGGGIGLAGAAMAGSGVLLIGLFLMHARRKRGQALIDPRLFAGRTFRAAAATQFLSNAINFGGQLLLPLYLLRVREVTPTAAGLLLIPAGLGVFCALPLMGRLSERFGARTISGCGAALALVGTLPFALLPPDAPYWLLLAALFVRGFGVGSITIPSAAAAYASVPREALSGATTAINICQRFGGPAGTTMMALFLQHALAQYAMPSQAFSATFWVLAGLAGLGVLTASRLPGPSAGSRT
jgi:EmrB/QacA subfamily drug resistance transporter